MFKFVAARTNTKGKVLMSKARSVSLVLLTGMALLARTAGAQTAASPTSNTPTQQRIDELDRKIEVLTEELRTLKEEQTLPETKEYKSAYGLGPAASKVYQVGRGLSLGGFG